MLDTSALESLRTAKQKGGFVMWKRVMGGICAIALVGGLGACREQRDTPPPDRGGDVQVHVETPPPPPEVEDPDIIVERHEVEVVVPETPPPPPPEPAPDLDVNVEINEDPAGGTEVEINVDG
jgi:hypothetical protein